MIREGASQGDDEKIQVEMDKAIDEKNETWSREEMRIGEKKTMGRNEKTKGKTR